MTEKKQLGKILLRQRALSPEQLDRALSEKKGGRLASRLTADGTISDVSALKALSEQHGIPGIDLGQICLKLETLDLLPREIAERHLILPVLMREDRLFVATANPRERKVLDELEFVTGKRVYPYVALEGPLEHVIEEAYTRKNRGEAYFVGSRCPDDVLKKLGIDTEGNQLERDSLPPEPAMFQSARPLEAPGGVVVDDEVGRLSQSHEIQEDDLDCIQPEDSVVSQPPEELARESALPPTPPGAKTILVVDDEADIRKMLCRLLAKAGYRVLEADRGVLALRLVKEQSPDLIVLDAMLPEVHGFDIARRIKGSRRYGNIPIVMVSAVYRGWRYAEDLRGTLGVDDFIEKPFTLHDVLARIQARLGANAEPPVESDSKAAARSDVDQALQQAIDAYKGGRIDEAIVHLQRGVAIDPLAFRLRYQLGLLYGRKGQVYEAVSELETAVSVNPQHFPAVKNLAILYQKAGFRNKAVETWERALALAPDEPTRLSIKDHLVRLL